MDTVRVKRPRPHAGQRAILKARKRYNVVRCGRRFGKTLLAVYLAIEVLLPMGDQAPGRVGYFAPNNDKFLEFWEEMVHRLAGVILTKNKNEKRITLINGAVLDCWTLDTDDPARSRMYDLAIVDEAGLLRTLSMHWRRAIRPTLLDRSGSAWFLGSPKPVGRDFDTLFKMGTRGRDEWASFSGKTLDNPHLPAQARADVEAAREEMPEDEWKEEYEGVPRGSASEFFREDVIAAHKERYACAPLRRGNLVIPLRYSAERDAILSEGKAELIQWQDDKKGRWRLWIDVDRRGLPRPRLGRTACLGVDIGCGVRSSNSVISGGNSDTGELLAKYASAGDSPEELARVAATFGYWIAGRVPARLNFDATGATGEQFIKALRQVEYPNIHIGRVSAAKVQQKSAESYGLRLDPRSKHALFSEYRAALQTERFLNRDERGLNECLQYHLDEFERVVHEREMAGEVDSDTGARMPHGDHVVADALLHQAMDNNPMGEPEEAVAPPGSFRWAQQQQEAEEAAASEDGF